MPAPNVNVLCLGADVVETELALKIVERFLTTSFEGGKQIERLKMIEEIENKNGESAK